MRPLFILWHRDIVTHKTMLIHRRSLLPCSSLPYSQRLLTAEGFAILCSCLFRIVRDYTGRSLGMRSVACLHSICSRFVAHKIYWMLCSPIIILQKNQHCEANYLHISEKCCTFARFLANCIIENAVNFMFNPLKCGMLSENGWIARI